MAKYERDSTLECGYGYIDEKTPELAISVKKEFRGQGIGKRLMQEIIILLERMGIKKVSLRVNRENCAYQMYCNLGFQVRKIQEECCSFTAASKSPPTA